MTAGTAGFSGYPAVVRFMLDLKSNYFISVFDECTHGRMVGHIPNQRDPFIFNGTKGFKFGCTGLAGPVNKTGLLGFW